MTRRPLTPKQYRVFRFIMNFYAKRGRMPHIREVMNSFRLASPNGAHNYFRALVKRGWLTHSSARDQYGRYEIVGLAEHLAPHVRAFAEGVLKAEGAGV